MMAGGCLGGFLNWPTHRSHSTGDRLDAALQLLASAWKVGRIHGSHGSGSTAPRGGAGGVASKAKTHPFSLGKNDLNIWGKENGKLYHVEC